MLFLDKRYFYVPKPSNQNYAKFSSYSKRAMIGEYMFVNFFVPAGTIISAIHSIESVQPFIVSKGKVINGDSNKARNVSVMLLEPSSSTLNLFTLGC